MTEYEILENILVSVNALNYKIGFIIALTLFILVLFIIHLGIRFFNKIFD